MEASPAHEKRFQYIPRAKVTGSHFAFLLTKCGYQGTLCMSWSLCGNVVSLDIVLPTLINYSDPCVNFLLSSFTHSIIVSCLINRVAKKKENLWKNLGFGVQLKIFDSREARMEDIRNKGPLQITFSHREKI